MTSFYDFLHNSIEFLIEIPMGWMWFWQAKNGLYVSKEPICNLSAAAAVAAGRRCRRTDMYDDNTPPGPTGPRGKNW